MSILRWLQLLITLIIAIPIGLVGVFNLIDGNYIHAIAFFGFSFGLVLLSEYIYIRLRSRTIGRLKRITQWKWR